MQETGALAKIQRQIQWNRLIAVVEEQAQTMIRTAFSTTVREAGDLSAGIFDLQGRMLAQAVTGTPGHVNSMMESVGHFLAKFPASTMQPGDHYITNDPWLGTGHLHDLTVVTPAFRNGADRRPLRQYRPYHRHRRPRHGPRGPQRLRGGALHPHREVLRPQRAERDLLRLHPRRQPHAGGAGRRHLQPLRLQRRRRQAAGRDAGRVQHGQPRPAGRVHLRELAAARRWRRSRKLPRGTFAGAIRSDGYEFAVTLQRGDDHPATTAIEVDYAGTSGLSTPRHQRPRRLLPGLFLLRHQMRGGAGDPEQLGLAQPLPHGDPGGLHPERPAPLSGQRPPCGRASCCPT